MLMHNPPHPGGTLKEALASIPISVTDFSAHLGISRVALSRILNEKAAITPEMSIKIGEAFQQPPDTWFNVQAAHDFWKATQVRRKKVQPLEVAA